MATQITPAVLAAASNPAAANHSLAFGQVFATILLGLTEAGAALANPTSIPVDIAQFTAGFLQTWFPTLLQPTAPTTTPTA